MKVSEIMRRAKTIDSSASAREAAEEMSHLRIGCLLVIDEKKCVRGIVTERDILQKVAAKNKLASDVNVEEIMTSKVVTIHPEALIDDAVYLMIKHKIKKLPVIDNSKDLVGIITATDIVSNSSELGQFYMFG